MKYQLKDICSITKGAIGIMKAIPGKYPLVALSDKRRSHNEYQFDKNAVIVPLISSTGHGDASMKRVHYQEGKFALGNILCAVIPNDEKQLNAKYLHLYLQQFKESLLVPLMKGAANVSLPMNKLAGIEIEVPDLEKQLEIIELEDKVTGLKTELEQKLNLQYSDVNQLRQAFLREAMQGKLVPQDKNDEPATELLKRIKTDKEKLIAEGEIKKQKPLPEIEPEEIPYEIPESWVWCRLGEIISISSGDGLIAANMDELGKIPVYGGNGITGYHSKNNINKETIVIGRVGAYCGSIHLSEKIAWVTDNAFITKYSESNIDRGWLIYCLKAINLRKLSFDGAQPVISGKRINPSLIPLPPLAEQQRIVSKLEQLMQLCSELEKNINQSKEETNLLLQTVLREALEEKEN